MNWNGLGPFEFRYRKFENSKLATWVDYHTHSTVSRVVAVGLVNIAILFPLIMLAIELPRGTAYNILTGIMGGLIVLAFFEPWLIRRFSDRFDWAGKIALAQAKRDIKRKGNGR